MDGHIPPLVSHVVPPNSMPDGKSKIDITSGAHYIHGPPGEKQQVRFSKIRKI
jgi:hypothetical protein